jgi:hypothetical protein
MIARISGNWRMRTAMNLNTGAYDRGRDGKAKWRSRPLELAEAPQRG